MRQQFLTKGGTRAVYIIQIFTNEVFSVNPLCHRSWKCCTTERTSRVFCEPMHPVEILHCIIWPSKETLNINVTNSTYEDAKTIRNANVSRDNIGLVFPFVLIFFRMSGWWNMVKSFWNFKMLMRTDRWTSTLRLNRINKSQCEVGQEHFPRTPRLEGWVRLRWCQQRRMQWKKTCRKLARVEFWVWLNDDNESRIWGRFNPFLDVYMGLHAQDIKDCSGPWNRFSGLLV